MSCIAAAAVLTFSALVFAQPQTISLNQKRIDISDLIKRVGEATDRTILFDDSVRGVVSIVAKRPVTLEEAWSMLGTSLSVRGFTILPSAGGIWRVAKAADAIGESPFVDKVVDYREAYVTSLIPLRVASVDAVMKVLEPLSGSSVTLVPFERTNSLIASGPERRIARLTTLADAVDRIDERPIKFRVIRYREVGEIVSWLEAFFESGAISRREIEIWMDERTNSLIYRANEKGESRLRNYVDRFDRPLRSDGQIRVLKILNRDAEEVADLIRNLGPSGSVSGSSSNLSAATRLSQSQYSITADTASRSLIVSTDPETHEVIAKLVEQLDEPSQLIAVDIKLTEVLAPRAFSLGFAFSIPLSTGDDSSDVVARLVSTPLGAGLSATPGPETTLFSRVDQDLNVPFTIDDGSGVAIPIANTGVIQAGDVQFRTEVLVSPSLVVTVGDTHEIFVGANVPVPVSSIDTTTPDGDVVGVVDNPLRRETTIERQDIGIKLVVEATASREGPIQLDLEVELSRLGPSIAGEITLVGPTFIKQSFLVNARLQDGEAAIVAINKNHRGTDGESGTPFLSDIPLLGWFFSSKGSRAQDTHLVLAAQARRITTAAEFAADTIRRRLAFERRNAREDALPGVADEESEFAVLVTTRGREDDAVVIAESLELRGYRTEIHRWELNDRELFDVYVTSLDSMADAAAVASILSRDGWQADLTLLPTRS